MSSSSRRKIGIAAVALLSLIAAGIVIAFGGRKGDSSRAGAQVRAVSIAIDRYTRTHEGWLPDFGDPLLESSLLNRLNAADGADALAKPLLARPETHEPYIFNMAISGQRRSALGDPQSVIVFYESRENYGGRLVAFLDGHHIWATAQQWDRLKSDLKP